MAGAQVLEWTDLDSEIKTAGLKDVSGSSSASSRAYLLDRILFLLQTCMCCSCNGGDSSNRHPGTIGWLMLTCAIIGVPVSRSGELRLGNI